MITAIQIDTVATFASRQTIDDLKTVNYFFGANGTGKSTLGRVIKNTSKYPLCAITWQHKMPLQKRVYNRYFIERNFNEPNGLPGIFTLGNH